MVVRDLSQLKSIFRQHYRFSLDTLFTDQLLKIIKSITLEAFLLSPAILKSGKFAGNMSLDSSKPKACALLGVITMFKMLVEYVQL